MEQYYIGHLPQGFYTQIFSWWRAYVSHLLLTFNSPSKSSKQVSTLREQPFCLRVGRFLGHYYYSTHCSLVGSLRLAHTGRHHYCSCIYLFVCACAHMHAWSSEHTASESFLFFHLVHPQDRTPTVRFGGEHLYPLTLPVLHCHHWS